MKLKAIFITLVSLTGMQASAARLAVVNKADGTTSVYNLKSKKLEFTLSTGYFPHEVAVSKDGQQIFVSNYGKDHVRSTSELNRPGRTVSVIDLKSRAVIQDIDLGENCAPHGLVATTQRLYITCENRQEIAVVDLNTHRLLHTIPTAQAQSHVMVISPDESRAYIANFSPGTVTVIDLNQRLILKQILTGPGTEGIGLSADGRSLYATSVLGATVHKIDTQTLEIAASVQTDLSPIRVTPTPDGKYALVNSSATNQLLIFDAQTLTLVKRLPVGLQPIGLDVPNSDQAFVANMKDNTVSVIDLRRLEVSAVIATGNKPDGLVYVPSNK